MAAKPDKKPKPDGRRKKKRERQEPDSWRLRRVAFQEANATLLELEVAGYWPASITGQMDGTVIIAAKHTGLVCHHCGDPQPPGTDPRRLYCSPSCRTMASRARTSGARVERKNAQRFG